MSKWAVSWSSSGQVTASKTRWWSRAYDLPQTLRTVETVSRWANFKTRPITLAILITAIICRETPSVSELSSSTRWATTCYLRGEQMQMVAVKSQGRKRQRLELAVMSVDHPMAVNRFKLWALTRCSMDRSVWVPTWVSRPKSVWSLWMKRPMSSPTILAWGAVE